MSGRKPLNDIKIGEQFGQLTVRELFRAGGERKAFCLCACGKAATPTEHRLRRGKAVACRSCIARRAWTRVVRLPFDEIELRISEKNYRQSAAKRNLAWELPRWLFRALINRTCSYCGLHPSRGIDRRDNAQGYTSENSVPCCTQCNYGKRDQTEAEFLNWIRRLVKYQEYDL